MMVEKMRAIDRVIKEHGEENVYFLGSKKNLEVDRQSFGVVSMDIATGGGVPKGRIIEVYGGESSGKTTTSLCAIAEFQKKGGVAAFIDVEQSFDPKYAQLLGVDLESLIISQPESGEQALEIAEALIRSGAIDILVVDSVAALVTEDELDGGMGASHIGKTAKLMGQALRKLTPIIKKTNCSVIFINQVREKIGITFGNPEVTSGGKALKFFSTIRMEVRRLQVKKVGDSIVGNRVRVRVVKNKVAPPFRIAEFDIVYGKGICKMGDLLDTATSLDVVKKSGAWYSFDDVKLGQGRDRVVRYLEENLDIAKKIESLVKKEFDCDKNEEPRLLNDIGVTECKNDVPCQIVDKSIPEVEEITTEEIEVEIVECEKDVTCEVEERELEVNEIVINKDYDITILDEDNVCDKAKEDLKEESKEDVSSTDKECNSKDKDYAQMLKSISANVSSQDTIEKEKPKSKPKSKSPNKADKVKEKTEPIKKKEIDLFDIFKMKQSKSI